MYFVRTNCNKNGSAVLDLNRAAAFFCVCSVIAKNTWRSGISVFGFSADSVADSEPVVASSFCGVDAAFNSFNCKPENFGFVPEVVSGVAGSFCVESVIKIDDGDNGESMNHSAESTVFLWMGYGGFQLLDPGVERSRKREMRQWAFRDEKKMKFGYKIKDEQNGTKV